VTSACSASNRATRREDGYGGLILAPRTNYTVARVKRDMGNGSPIGLLGMSKQYSGYHNRIFAGDWDFALTKSLRFGGYLAKSSTPGLDGDDVAGDLDLYFDNRNWRLHTEYIDIGKNFNDEMGYMARTNIRTIRTDYFFILWPETGPFKLVWFTYDYDYIEYKDTHSLQTRNSHIQYNSYFRDSSGFAYKYFIVTEVLRQPFEIRRGIVLPPGTYDFPTTSWLPDRLHEAARRRRAWLGRYRRPPPEILLRRLPLDRASSSTAPTSTPTSACARGGSIRTSCWPR
jgi:hypothetical protein